MPKRRLPYREGDCFVVPLRDGRKAVGVVARMNGKGGAIGYFFGPAYAQIPATDVLARLAPKDAVLVANFGDLGLLRGQWKVVGWIEPWQREDWPLPVFVRRDAVTGTPRKAVYREPNLNIEVELLPCSEEEAKRLPKDGIMGSGFVEIRLTKLLADRERGVDGKA